MDLTAVIVALITGGLTLAGTVITQAVVKAKAQMKLEYGLKEVGDVVKEQGETLKTLTIELQKIGSASHENDEKLKSAIMRVARDRINQAYRYFTSLGEIDEHSKEALMGLYETYHDMGGNTFIDDEMEVIRRLPVVSILKIQNGGKNNESDNA